MSSKEGQGHHVVVKNRATKRKADKDHAGQDLQRQNNPGPSQSMTTSLKLKTKSKTRTPVAAKLDLASRLRSRTRASFIQKITECKDHAETFSATSSDDESTPIGKDSTVNSKKMKRSFFDVPCVDLAKNLLGQNLVRLKGSQRISGRIVETEAYLGFEDKAAHTYKGKRTPRNEAMFMDPGTCYVYNIYGMYRCLNISSQGTGAAVLIRALEAVEGQETMRGFRKQKNASKTLKDKELTNGPSKLCQALDISKNEFNQVDLASTDCLWLERGETVDSSHIVSSARINIGYADDWKDKPLRFYILGNKSVSVRDKKAEQEAHS